MARPSKFNKEIIKKTDEYINSCDIDEQLTQFVTFQGEKSTSWTYKFMKAHLPTLEGLALYLSVSRDTVHEWRKLHQEFSDACERLMCVQAVMLIEYGLSGLYKSSVAVRMLASNHGYIDSSPKPTWMERKQQAVWEKSYDLDLNPKIREAQKKYQNDMEAIMKEQCTPRVSPYQI